MDVFVEPILPKPMLPVLGASPVAVAVAKLAGDMGFAVTAAATAEELARFGPLAQSITGYDLPATTARDLFVVVSTQGTGDRAALTAATKMDAMDRNAVVDQLNSSATARIPVPVRPCD